LGDFIGVNQIGNNLMDASAHAWGFEVREADPFCSLLKSQ
jgi:hypothetical protein